MVYITVEEYRALAGEPPDDFDALNQIAECVINQETLWGLAGRSLDSLPAIIRDSVKKAATFEIDYLDQIGGLPSANAPGLASASLGKFSYTSSAGADKGLELVGPVTRRELILVGAYLRGL